MKFSLDRATEPGLCQLYAHYARPLGSPFFIDVSGPPPLMRREDFEEYCTENESRMMLWQRDGNVAGCAHFRDKQLGLELANFDIIFFADYPKPDSTEALAFAKAFKASCKDQGLSRVQLLALESEREKIEFLESIGFKNEGVLREHYFFGSAVHNLVMLGWTSADRVKRMAALADEEDHRQIDIDAARKQAAAIPALKPGDPRAGVCSRRVDEGDKDMLVRWYGHPLIQETIEDEELSPKALRAKAKKLAAIDEFRDGECAFIVEFDGVQIALAHFMWIDWVSRTGELDWFLAPDVKCGPFLARSAIREIGRIGFEGLGLRKLYGFTYASNDTSLRINANFMTTEAVLKNYLPHPGGGADVHVQGLLESEYAAQYSVRRRNPGSTGPS